MPQARYASYLFPPPPLHLNRGKDMWAVGQGPPKAAVKGKGAGFANWS